MLEELALRYTPFYCEENVFQLLECGSLSQAADPQASVEVVFISNAHGQVACWEQRASPVRGQPIAWDYHVVAAVRTPSACEVWDLDSHLGYPVPAATWLARTFRDPMMVRPRFWPLFRVASRAQFLAEFATDRSHMRRADGSWRRPPPPWPAPGAPHMNLRQWVDMTPGEGPGTVMNRLALEAYWGLVGAGG